MNPLTPRVSSSDSNTPSVLDSIERRAREAAGGIHVHGAIPARFWPQAIAERFLGEPIRDPNWAERMLERWGKPEVHNKREKA